MFDILKESIEFYKKSKNEYKQKQQLINNNWDVKFLQDTVKKVNDNPGLRVCMRWPDGKILELSSYAPSYKKGTASYNVLEEIDL